MTHTQNVYNGNHEQNFQTTMNENKYYCTVRSGKPTLTHYVQAIFCANKQTMLIAMLNAITKLNVLCNVSSMKEKSRVPWTGILEGCKPGKSSLSVKRDRIIVVLTSLGQQPLPRDILQHEHSCCPCCSGASHVWHHCWTPNLE